MYSRDTESPPEWVSCEAICVEGKHPPIVNGPQGGTSTQLAHSDDVAKGQPGQLAE